jgi:GntR family transcriptional regulator
MMHACRRGRNTARPLHVQLRDDLAARIADGEWPPGFAIPPGYDLAATYDVSLHTVRRAIDHLVDEGVLKRKQGSGTFVRRRTEHTDATHLQMCVRNDRSREKIDATF